MGAPAQPNAPTQVYYDPENQQYFNYKQTEDSNPIANMFANSGIPILVNGKQYSQTERNYLSNPYNNSSANRFIPKNIPAQYPAMNMLFPSLNLGSSQGLMSPTQPDGAMYGAGRFLAPQTTSESKGK
jgi:hypothetical protein